MTAPDDEELRDLLFDLESTLEELRSELQDSKRYQGLPRPPSFGELLRFTDTYTIPTLIALLETTIRLLELLGGLLRMADPERSVVDTSASARTRETRDRLAGARKNASNQLAGALSELRTALAETSNNLPDEPEARSVIEDARELSREIEQRLQETDGNATNREEGDGRGGDEETDGRDGTDGAVTIEVTDGSNADDAADDTSPDDGDVDGAEAESGKSDVDGSEADPGQPEVDGSEVESGEPEVDVEAELESIKRQVKDDHRNDPANRPPAEDAESGTADNVSNGPGDRSAESGGMSDDNDDASAENDGSTDDDE